MDISAPNTAVQDGPATAAPPGPVLLVGNPNAGKTTLFNQLTGLRLKTANFPGTTLDLRTGGMELGGRTCRLIDLPGLYSLDAAAYEERAALSVLTGTDGRGAGASLIILLIDATNLARNLVLASQVLELGVPVVAALNMMDLADREGLRIDTEALAGHLGCAVVPVVAKTGRGKQELLAACETAQRDAVAPGAPKLLRRAEAPSHAQRYDWAETVCDGCVEGGRAVGGRWTDWADRVFMNPVAGVAAFFAIMFGVFYLIFSLAAAPMDLIDAGVAAIGEAVGGWLPEGPLNSLVTDGVIGGVGSVLIFLPQICILFFCLSLLEDTGYLARAACVMDRLLRRFGLPGKAFVPMLSAHACAIPAIMSARVIENRRDRILTILVLPLLTCSARLPVYAMVTALLFPDSPAKGAAAFTGAYALGIAAALSMALLFSRTILRGQTDPLMLELPLYKAPSLKTALLAAYDRGRTFVRNAGTVILAISIVLWWLTTYPQTPADEAAGAAAVSVEETAPEMSEAQRQLAGSFAGRLGHFIEPVIAPLGFDWKIGVGIIASFAAREMVVSALAVVYGVADEEGGTLIGRLRGATHPDGRPVFTPAACLSLLVFYVLAMQCLPTQVVTARETKSWRWAVFQLTYMTLLAYSAAFVTYRAALWLA